MAPSDAVPQAASSAVAHGTTHPDSDVIADAVARVRADLQARRERGELPEFPPDEMRRHFDAVVEAYEGALLALPPIDFDKVRSGKVMTGRISPESRVPGGSTLHRTVAKIVGRQIHGLAQQMRIFGDELVSRMEDLADRQDRMRRFLLVAHLDRVRQLEYRVAQLELELARERAANGATSDGAQRSAEHG